MQLQVDRAPDQRQRAQRRARRRRSSSRPRRLNCARLARLARLGRHAADHWRTTTMSPASGNFMPRRLRATWSMRLLSAQVACSSCSRPNSMLSSSRALLQPGQLRRTAARCSWRANTTPIAVSTLATTSTTQEQRARSCRRPSAELFRHPQHRAARARVARELGGVGLLRAADRAQRRHERLRRTGMRRLPAGGLGVARR